MKRDHSTTIHTPIPHYQFGYPIKSSVNQLLGEVKPDLVVFDTVGLGRLADLIRTNGLPVLGGCRWADEAETDYDYGCKLMKQVGINITRPDTQTDNVELE